jgi:prepilin-type N-terminal cleavage/methylation domain-containing protein
MISKRNRGFSLVELLVVVLILGTTLGIAAPRVTQAVRAARMERDRATLLANLTTWQERAQALRDPALVEWDRSTHSVLASSWNGTFADTLRLPGVTEVSFEPSPLLLSPAGRGGPIEVSLVHDTGDRSYVRFYGHGVAAAR